MAHDLEAARDVLEDLGHILPNLAQPIAAAGATCGRHRLVCLRRAGQMLGQLPTTLLLASFSRFRIGSWLRRRSGLALTPLQSATAAIVAPGESASSRILSFSSAIHRRRRSTVEMISVRLSIGVLTHVRKDSNAYRHDHHRKAVARDDVRFLSHN